MSLLDISKYFAVQTRAGGVHQMGVTTASIREEAPPAVCDSIQARADGCRSRSRGLY